MKKKYADQSDEDRKIALELLGAKEMQQPDDGSVFAAAEGKDLTDYTQEQKRRKAQQVERMNQEMEKLEQERRKQRVKKKNW